MEPVIWYVILYVLFALYFIFEAYEWGAGMVYGLYASDDDEKLKVLSSVKSIWAANEVWLLAFVGLSYVVFPVFFQSISSFFKGLFFVFVFVYMLQIISSNLLRVFFERRIRPLFEWIYVLSSFALTLIAGLFVALLFRGDVRGDMPLWSRHFSPFAEPKGYMDYFVLLFLMLFLVIVMLNGLGWVVHRSSGAFGRKLKFKVQKLAVAGIVLVIINVVISYFINARPLATKAHWIAWLVFVILMLGSLGGLMMIRTYQKDNKGFFLATNLFVYFWVAFLLRQYPYLIFSGESEGGISVFRTVFRSLKSYHLQWWTIGIALVLFVYSILVHKFSKGHALLTAQRKK